MISIVGSMFLAACVGATSPGHLGVVKTNAAFCVPGDLRAAAPVAWVYVPGEVAELAPVAGSPGPGHNLLLIAAPPGVFYQFGWSFGPDLILSDDIVQTCAKPGYVGGGDFANLRAALSVGFLGGGEYAEFRARISTACLDQDLPSGG